MADLTLAQMLALLPDNTTGAIDAVDLREIITALFERTDGTNAIAGLLFDTSNQSVGVGAGNVRWNTDIGTLDLDTSTDATLQVGHESYVNALNMTGSAILNGSPVQIVGGLGDNALVDVDNGQGKIIGLATEGIPDGTVGRVTTFGVVHNLDTSAFASGDLIHADNVGAFTTAITGSVIGYVLFADAMEGRVLVRAARRSIDGGPSANRPINPQTWFQYYDSDIPQAIWWSGTEWVDYSGAPV